MVPNSNQIFSIISIPSKGRELKKTGNTTQWMAQTTAAMELIKSGFNRLILIMDLI